MAPQARNYEGNRRPIPYRSSVCRIGSHRRCVRLEPPETPIVGVVFEACGCPCHVATTDNAPGAVTQ